jgi:hypothetical protein
VSHPKAAVPLSLRVFGRLPQTIGGAPTAGVRKASREETADEVRDGGGAGLWGFERSAYAIRRVFMSSIMRWRNGLMALLVMTDLLSWERL